MAITLKAMEYFTTALRHGSITKAASELNIAASAVAIAIDQVEVEFGLKLVTRQRARGIQANASGREIARKCTALLEEYRSLLAEGAALGSSLSGTLRIGYYAPIAPAFLPSVLEACLPSDAGVTLHLEECDNDQAQDGLLGGTFDVVLFVAKDVRPAIAYDVLITAPPYCLMPADHPLAEKASVSMAQIASEPLIVLNRPVATSYYEALISEDAEQGRVVAYANSTEMVRSLVAAGRGCAILNMKPLTAQSYSGADVVARPISDDVPALTLAIGYDKHAPRRLVRVFVEACRAHFAASGEAQCIVTMEAGGPSSQN
ncbi:LysR family transcriptional regulator [Primorskyibacter sp. S187A]|uniref:LysR family transcriptional regulator n=1 Tax=Primorskyibacter sp. S187A TaxID=3415130 RepID=UPI003C7D9C6F